MCALRDHVRALLLICVVTACAASDPDDGNRARCTQLRDHIVDLRLSDLPKDQAQSVIASHREAMASALGEQFVTSCQQSAGKRELDCGLAARDVSAATRCLER